MEAKEYTGVKVVMDGMHFEANKVPVEDVTRLFAAWSVMAESRLSNTMAREHNKLMVCIAKTIEENTPVAAGACSASE